MPRGTTQVVTRGASNDWCQMCRWRLDQSDGDTWHWRVSVRGTVAVSTRPKEFGIKDLFGGEICNRKSPGGSIVEAQKSRALLLRALHTAVSFDLHRF
ncbi:hypothetical protein Tco_0150538 [Tanacetum coccineum]